MHALLLGISRGVAVVGGIGLVALILLTIASILGRLLDRMWHWMVDAQFATGFAEAMIAAGIGPISGVFELIEGGIAFVIFSFLPICQITGGHASVDLFTSRMSAGANRVLRALCELLFAAAMCLIVVQLFGGLQSKLNSGQTTFELQLSVWYFYAVSLIGAVLTAIVSCYLAAARIVEALTGRALLSRDLGAEF